MRRLLTALCLLAVAGVATAQGPQVKVVALFPDRAMLEIDGKQRLLRAGQTSPEGVKLIAADTHEAVVDVDGRRETLGFGSSVGGTFAARETTEVTIYRDLRGSYTAVGSINGRPVNFLVDTGASAIAMSAAEARRLGIAFRIDGDPVGVSTASGVARGHRVTLDRVSVGDLTLRGVDALIIAGDRPEQVLLGMTFLNRVDMRQDGTTMVLRAK
ncbi:MAG: TIGR02281 family clan AA aspartic protease [Gammaproteobacteria bacterium]|jgi:aspartyl protease family protein|nr:TIGR02281 family clan AA aspartic protease [Gammaproteobacteria bacterium]